MINILLKTTPELFSKIIFNEPKGNWILCMCVKDTYFLYNDQFTIYDKLKREHSSKRND